MYDAGDRKDVRRAEKAAHIAGRQRSETVASIMSGAPGRAYFHEQLSIASVFATTFDRDPIVMAFNEGRRNQGLLLLNDIMQYNPDNFILMMREANERHIARERASGENAGGRSSGSDAEPADSESDPERDAA